MVIAMARPKKQIDERQVFKLARILCTTDEIAAVLECSKDTIERRFAALLKRGREVGRQSLRRKQYQLALKGHPTMLVWLGKQYLGQSDKVVHTGEDGGPIQQTVTHAFDVERFADLYRRRTGGNLPRAGTAEANGN